MSHHVLVTPIQMSLNEQNKIFTKMQPPKEKQYGTKQLIKL